MQFAPEPGLMRNDASMLPTESAPPIGDQSRVASDKPTPPAKPKEGTRDTIESILFAFLLAFLFRTFEAEAFVIPTGSMAPTLYGRHKEADCPACNHRIVVGASHEVIAETGHLMPNVRLRGAVCSNCGFVNDEMSKALAFNGDRILVNKFPYEFGNPDRWDVFVFKYPAEPQTNYIKRLVGLPGETLRIRNGDLFQVENKKELTLRKSPEKQRSLQIPVYDDTQPARELLKAGWPERWASMNADPAGKMGKWSDSLTGWQRDENKRTYSVKKEETAPSWLRYRHYFPMPHDWQAASHGMPLAPAPRLIADFCGYNATIGDPPFDAQSPAGVDFGAYWVPDLTINFNLKIQEIGDQPELILELCEGTTWYRCRIDVSTGAATLEEVNSQLNERVRELATAKTRLKGTGNYRISYANVDDRICLWINDSLVDFGEGALVESPGATGNPYPTQQDLSPVGIATQGISATVSELLLERDVYYRVGQPGRNFAGLSSQLARHLGNPEAWAEFFAEHSRDLGERTLEVPLDHFLAFGDNSPQSNDSRMWDSGHEAVPRKFLVGKAFWIYWPHGVPFLDGGRGFPLTYHYQQGPNNTLVKVKDYPRYMFPFYPQFWRMNRIR